MQFYFRIFLYAKIIILVLSFMGIQTAIAETYRVYNVVSRDVLYIRERPSSKSKKIGSIPPSGKGIEKLGPCERVWCKISYRGMTGWSSMKYLVVEKLAKPSLKPVKADPKPLNQVGLVAFTSTTTVRQNGIKSNPYKLHGKTYFIEVRGTVNYKTDPRLTDNPGIYGVDACYLFSFTPSNIKVPPVAIKLLKNTGNNDVCASARYNPQHIYRSKPFVSKNSYQFWIDNSAYRAKPSGRGFLSVNIYETSKQK